MEYPFPSKHDKSNIVNLVEKKAVWMENLHSILNSNRWMIEKKCYFVCICRNNFVCSEYWGEIYICCWKKEQKKNEWSIEISSCFSLDSTTYKMLSLLLSVEFYTLNRKLFGKSPKHISCAFCCCSSSFVLSFT